jgi:hypothetical protein
MAAPAEPGLADQRADEALQIPRAHVGDDPLEPPTRGM